MGFRVYHNKAGRSVYSSIHPPPIGNAVRSPPFSADGKEPQPDEDEKSEAHQLESKPECYNRHAYVSIVTSILWRDTVAKGLYNLRNAGKLNP